MRAGESHKTEAFILKSLGYGESDLIITFYSREFGKIKGIAKGAKKSKKRFVNVFEPFSRTHVIFTRKSRDMLVFIESCEIADHYASIREDLEKTLIASYFIDLADHFSPEGKVNEALFFLLADYLSLMNHEDVSDAMIRFFEMRLLKISGFEPALTACVRCNKPVINGSSYYFRPQEGGITCSKCVRPEFRDQTISAGTIRTLLLGREMDLEKMKRVFLPEGLACESRNVLLSFISYVLGKEVKSLRVMEQVRKLCP